MRKINQIHVLAICLLMAFTSSAQDWVKMMQDPNINFYNVQKEFNLYWSEREKVIQQELLQQQRNGQPNTEKLKELRGGFAPYKRWEWFMEQRVYPHGNRFSPSIAWDEYSKYISAVAGRNSTHVAGGNWTLRGPISQGCTGRVNCIRFHPSDPNIVYAGAASGGLWKSTDGGTNWTTNTDNLGSLGVSDLAFDPVNSNILYLATGDKDHKDAYSVGLLKSTDGGSTWKSTGLNYLYSDAKLVNRILINSSDPNILIVATNGGLFRSADAGNTWTQVITGKFLDVNCKPGNPNIVYAASSVVGSGGYAFYRSADGGVTYSVITAGLPASTSVSRVALAVTPANSSYVYLLASSTGYGFYGLYLSTDDGLTFTRKSNSPNIVGSQGWYNLPLAVSPTNANEVFSGGFYIYRSTDAGTTWSNVGGSAVHPDVHDLIFLPGSSTTVLAGHDGGVNKTTNNGTNWTNITRGLQIAQPYSVGISTSNASLTLSGLQDNGTRKFDGTTWTQPLGGDGMIAFIDGSDNTYMYSEAYNGNLQRSTNGGSSFSGINAGLSEPGAWVTPWLQDPNVPQTLYVGRNNVWKSTDRGTTWTKISNFGSSLTLDAVAVAPSNSNYIYASSYRAIYKTADGGTTWTNITGTLPASVTSISDIAIKSTDPNTVWVTFSGFNSGVKVFESVDGGTTWKNISFSLPNLPVNSIVYQNNSPDGIYIGMDIGVYYKEITMNSWQLFNSGLPNVVVSQLKIHYGSGKLVASTFGRGIWESDLYTSSSIVPAANFISDITAICSPGSVSFTDISSYSPSSWLWDFGDGTVSTLQNPVHTYTSNGIYAVKLVVGNTAGKDSAIKTGFITVDIPAGPSVTGDTRCGTGPVNLSATPNASVDILRWYDAATGSTLLNTGNTYIPVISSTTTFYVEEQMNYPVQNTGAPDNTMGAGSYYSSNDNQFLRFDAHLPVTLIAVTVYSDSAGTRNIQLLNNKGIVLQTASVNIPAGKNRVVLNFKLFSGTGYMLKVTGKVRLYKNDTGVNFPYTIPGVLSVTGSNVAGGYYYPPYYFFYNWEVQKDPCVSQRVPVTGIVDCATSLKELPEGERLIIYPNPSQGIFEISYSGSETSSFTIEVTNLLGEIIFSELLDGFSGTYKRQVNLHSAGKGVYFVTIKNRTVLGVKKVITY